jgi:hypothetical protein
MYFGWRDYIFFAMRTGIVEAPISGHAEPSSISADPYSNRRIPRLKRD